MGWRGYHWTVNVLYFLECRAGDFWQWASGDEVSCWWDWLPALVYKWRKAAERRHPVSF